MKSVANSKVLSKRMKVGGFVVKKKKGKGVVDIKKNALV